MTGTENVFPWVKPSGSIITRKCFTFNQLQLTGGVESRAAANVFSDFPRGRHAMALAQDAIRAGISRRRHRPQAVHGLRAFRVHAEAADHSLLISPQ